MKKLLFTILVLSISVFLAVGAYAENSPESITLTFQGEAIACHPIALTQNDAGTFILILYEKGLNDFALSQRYNVPAPIFACILDEKGKPLNPNQTLWDRDIVDCCYFFYKADKMPETLSLIPLDAVDDTTKWQTIAVADIPSQVPEGYMLDPEQWNYGSADITGAYVYETDSAYTITVLDDSKFQFGWGMNVMTGDYIMNEDGVYEFTQKSQFSDIHFTGSVTSEGDLLVTGDCKLINLNGEVDKSSLLDLKDAFFKKQ